VNQTDSEFEQMVRILINIAGLLIVLGIIVVVIAAIVHEVG